MSMSTRSLLVPGLALATAGAVALTPIMVAPAPTAAPPAVALPTLHVENVQLTGIGRDIYNTITPYVQYGVDSAAYWVNFIPLIGPPIADQIDINYFALIQPAIAATVYYASDLVANIFAFPILTSNYVANLGYIGYNWASAQAQFFGLPPLPPIPGPPPLAATGPRSAAAGQAAAAAKPRGPRAAATARNAAALKAAGAAKTAKSPRSAAASR